MTSRLIRYAVLLIAGSFIAYPAGAGTPAPAGTGTKSQQYGHLQNKQIVEAAFDHWMAGGSRFFEDVLSAEVVWTIEGSGPYAGTLHGRDALVQRAVRPLANRMSSPLRPIQRRIWADGDHVIVQWEGVGTLRDGTAYRNRYAWILRMRDGKAVEVNAFLDLPRYTDVLQGIADPTTPATSP